MTETISGHAEEAPADLIGNAVPARGRQTPPLVGLVGSAGAALQAFFRALPADSGQAFAVILHSSPEHESALPGILQRCTTMPVLQVNGNVEVAANTVYVVPPGKLIKTVDGSLAIVDEPATVADPGSPLFMVMLSDQPVGGNEELQAVNEELRCATEELRSINQELSRVNHELKGKVQELSSANSDIHNLMDAAGIAAVFLDRELRITRYTSSAVTLFNLIAADVGRPLAELATRLDCPQLAADAPRVLERLVPIEREVGLPDGKWFLSRLLPYRTVDDDIAGVVVSLIDITERKRAQEVRLPAAVASSMDAIISLAMDQTILSWNGGAERIFGYRAHEAIGQPVGILAPGRETEQADMASRLREGRSIAFETLRRRKDGSEVHVALSIAPIKDARGQVIGGTAVARETQQALERSQADLRRALEANEKVRAELHAADAARDRFLAVLSHELRNPLASIDSAAALLLAQDLPAADRDSAAQVVSRQTDAMKTLLDDLLDVTRLKLGRLELHRERVTLSNVVQAALESTRPMMDAACRNLEVDLPGDAIELDADPLRLGQALSNLLTNAVKYTRAGGKVTLNARIEGNQAVITVADDGIGIDPAQIERMFDMFTQAQSVANHNHTGLGIGLALVRSIVELHDGRVEASSAGLGRGSEFRIVLPAERAAAQPAVVAAQPPAAPPPAPALAHPQKRGLILIADDNVDAGWGMARLLEVAGFATSLVRGGHDALKEAQRQKPDVGVIDIGMPDLSGHEVARQLRRTEWGKRMVLIAATGWGQESDERAAIEAGFDAHMTKPLDLRKLGAAVDDLLLRRRR